MVRIDGTVGVSEALEARIRAAQVGLVYGRGFGLVLGAWGAAAGLMLFPWEGATRPAAGPWLAALSIAAIARLWLIAAWHRADAAARAGTGWGRLFWIGTLAAGLVWGTWPLVSYRPDEVEFLLLVSTVFAGMVAVSATSGGAHLPTFASFSVPLIVPLATAHLSSGRDSLVVTGALMLLFLGINFWLALRVNEQHAALIRAHFVNERLSGNLAREKRVAERAVVAKSRFLAAASHDLRQPLHALGLLVGALRRQRVDATERAIVDELGSSTAALKGLLDSLLDLSRLDAETVVFRPEHIDGDALFERLRARFDASARDKGLVLHLRPNGATLWTDPVLVERVLGNLLSNAIAYTPVGSVTLGCVAGAAGDHVVDVSDTGIGIPDASRDEVFGEYVQLGNAARDREAGLGLGLSIVRRLCALMDVPLVLRSSPGAGTTFSLHVPGGDPGQVRRDAAADASPVPVANGALVLVVDDDASVLEATGHLLESRGCTALLALDARRALRAAALAGRAPVLVLCDHRLGDGATGIDAVAALREAFDDPALKAAIVTGDTSPERLREIRASGLEALHKPVAPSTLDALLARALPARDQEEVARTSLPIVRPCTSMESSTIT